MGRKRKTDNQGDVRPPVITSFHEYLYKIRLNWVGHIIPIRYIDPSLNLFMEGYLISKIAKSEVEEDEELSEEEVLSPFNGDDLATVRSAYLSHKFLPIKEVPYKDIYPSRRKLTIIRQTDKLGDIALEQLYNEDMTRFEPAVKLPLEDVMKVFQEYAGIYWTIPEIASIVNRDIQEVEQFVKDNLDPAYIRVCKITTSEQMTYKAKPIKEEKVQVLSKYHKIAQTIPQLYENYRNCLGCNLGNKRVARNCNIVPAKGNFNSPKYMFIGEAPGVQEEEDGIPFNPKAPAGGLFLDVLVKTGFDKKDCYITNAVICRPPAAPGEKALNGKPRSEHILACNARLKNEIVLVNPKIIILLGKTAYEAYFGKAPDSVLKHVGWAVDKKVYFVAHPSYVVRQQNMASAELTMNEYLYHFKQILDSA